MDAKFIILAHVPTWGDLNDNFLPVMAESHGWESPVNDVLLFETLEEAEQYANKVFKKGTDIEIYACIREKTL